MSKVLRAPLISCVHTQFIFKPSSIFLSLAVTCNYICVVQSCHLLCLIMILSSCKHVSPWLVNFYSSDQFTAYDRQMRLNRAVVTDRLTCERWRKGEPHSFPSETLIHTVNVAKLNTFVLHCMSFMSQAVLVFIFAAVCIFLCDFLEASCAAIPSVSLPLCPLVTEWILL